MVLLIKEMKCLLVNFSPWRTLSIFSIFLLTCRATVLVFQGPIFTSDHCGPSQRSSIVKTSPNSMLWLGFHDHYFENGCNEKGTVTVYVFWHPHGWFCKERTVQEFGPCERDVLDHLWHLTPKVFCRFTWWADWNLFIQTGKPSWGELKDNDLFNILGASPLSPRHLFINHTFA